MLIIHPIQELMRALPALVGLLVAGASSGSGPWWGMIAVALAVAAGVLRWFTTSYRVTADQVQLNRGLLRRRLRAVARDRVRTVDVTAPVLHRLLRLARVTVGTGRSDRDEGGLRLDGLDAAEAAHLRVELLHRRPDPALASAPEAAVATREIEIARLRSAWIRFGPFTLSGIVAVGIIAGFVSNAASEAGIDPRGIGPLRDVADALARAPLALAVAEVVLASLLVVALLSTAGYVLAFWAFRLTRHPGGTLHVTRGLLTTRATSIEERRLRGVEVGEPLLLRAVRGARCIVIASGLRAGRGASLLLPPAPRQEAERVTADVLRTADPVTCPLVPHGPQARRRRYSRALGAWLPAIALLVALSWLANFPAWLWQASLLGLPTAAALAADRFRSLGHAVVAGRLVTRVGSLVRRRSILACDGVIGVNLTRSYFQRRAGLVTLSATTAAGRQRYDVPDVEAAEALRVAEETMPGLLAPFFAGPDGARGG
jgi:putative membrane protein